MASYRNRLIEQAIRIEYADLAQRTPSRTVRLADIRPLIQATRAEVDEALRNLGRRQDVDLHAEADQRTLTDEDRAAAIVLGCSARHTLFIETD